MSNGAQIGGVIGAAIGGYFGGPQGAQIGFTIGSTIGGYIDPAQVFGPKLRDAASQTAMDGVPRTYGYGTFPTAGNLIWTSALKERKKTESSKGSPTETVTYHYFRSYAIAVCRAPQSGDGIAGYRIIKRNGKVVYDTRTDAELSSLGYNANQIAETRAAQSKFIDRVTLYYGISDQPPDPTMQAVKGALDVPGYSYTAYIVVTDDDLTDMRGAVPQYEFVVSVCGERSDSSGTLLINGAAASGPRFAILNSDSLEVVPIDPSTGADLTDGVGAHDGEKWCVIGALTTRNAGILEDNWTSGTSPNAVFSEIFPDRQGGWFANTGGYLYEAGASGNFTPLARTAENPAHQIYLDISIRTIEREGFFYSLSDVYLFRCRNPRTDLWETIHEWPGMFSAGRGFTDLVWRGGTLYGCGLMRGSNQYGVCWSPDGGHTWPISNAVLLVGQNDDPPVRLVNTPSELVAYCNGGTIRGSFSNWAVQYPGIDGIGTGGNPRLLDTRQRFKEKDNNVYILGANADSNKLVVYDASRGIFSAPVELPFSGACSIAPEQLGIFGTPIPDAPGYYVDPTTGEIYGPSGTTISQCAPLLSEIVEDQCALREVTAIDVTELDDPVLGFRIANVSSPQKSIAALMPAYMFDASEYDGVIHFPKRGGSDSFALTIDDLVKREGDPIEWERIQEPELLRKVTVGYFDPTTTYTPTTQQWERRAGTVKAQGEGTIELPLVASQKIAAQAADMNGKVAWAEGDTCKLSVSISQAELVASTVGTVTDENGTVHRIRIEKISDSGLVRMIDGRRTSAHVYQSLAEGASKPLPTFPGSDIRGPTNYAIMNMPAILDSQDRVGIYWAASGVMTGWSGAQIEINRAGVWSVIGVMESPSGMGTLLNDVSAHYGDWDTVNSLVLSLNQEVESVTYEQLLSERNPLAIIYPDYTVEVVQFQNVEMDSDGNVVCTNLIRGRLDTVRGEHMSGAKVVILDNGVQFVDLRPAELGTTIQLRVVSLGTNPDAADTITVTLDRIWSSTEWRIDSLEIERAGDDFHLSWLRRDRLGTDVTPIRSVNWDGYSVRWQFGDQTGEEVTNSESLSTTIIGGTNVTFAVSQINRLTGNGPETIMVVP